MTQTVPPSQFLLNTVGSLEVIRKQLLTRQREGEKNKLLVNDQGMSWIGCSKAVGSKVSGLLDVLVLFSIAASQCWWFWWGPDVMEDWPVRGGSVESGMGAGGGGVVICSSGALVHSSLSLLHADWK